MLKRPKVSIIVVNYHSKDRLWACLKSIFASTEGTSFKIIVVDNDERAIIGSDLKKDFPKTLYLKTRANLGFSSACNLGAKESQGEFLFFLNPDTLILNNCLKVLVAFLKKEKKTGLVAPLILSASGRPTPVQGTGGLYPLSAIFSLSFLNKYWPKNPLASSYWLKKWDQKTVQEIDVAPGCAFLVRRQAFEEAGGFDKHFFLYFEETDLCFRLKSAGWKIYIEPKAQIVHFGGQSTAEIGERRKIFCQSRFYYFKKHWGIIWAIIVESFLRGAEFLARKR